MMMMKEILTVIVEATYIIQKVVELYFLVAHDVPF